ncbi:terpene synthase family protein [Streptomyces daliensis]|uniref:Glutamate dehydrogenase n=1 Tax=Streptomyces daliensis TaxID=299421 RepID=A0A8T4IWM5_9ACTN|nr:glutamate dehydrogenase [Streptomyces daliensis]
MSTGEPIQVRIPPLYCPIPPAIHPQHADMQHRSMEWMTRYGFCSDEPCRVRTASINGAEFVARMTPAGDRERMQVFADWAHLSLLFDDLYDALPDASASTALCDFTGTAVKVMRTFEAPEASLMPDDSPFTAPLRDLARRTHRIATPVQLRRMVEAQRLWLSCVAWEIACKPRAHLLGLNDYIVLRMGTVGGTATSSWIEILNGTEAPDHEMDSPLVRALAESAGLIVGMDEDLYSYGKDLWHQRHDGTPLLNFVGVTAHELGCTHEKALLEVAAMRNQLMCLFLALRDRALRHAGPALTRYVTDLGHYIRANADWGTSAGRYRNPDGRSPDAVSIRHEWTDDAPDFSGEPLPLPAIAWWWHQLRPDRPRTLTRGVCVR